MIVRKYMTAILRDACATDVPTKIQIVWLITNHVRNAEKSSALNFRKDRRAIQRQCMRSRSQKPLAAFNMASRVGRVMCGMDAMVRCTQRG